MLLLLKTPQMPDDREYCNGRTDRAPQMSLNRRTIAAMLVTRRRSRLLALSAVLLGLAGAASTSLAANPFGADYEPSPTDEQGYASSQDESELAHRSDESSDGIDPSAISSSFGNAEGDPASSCCRRECTCDLPCAKNGGQCCRSPAPADPYLRLLPQDGLIRVRGWVDAGILGNTASPASHFNGPYNSQEVDNGQFNQFYLIFDRALRDDGSFSVGGRFDLLYGSDYFLAQSTGLELTRSGTSKWNSSQYYGLALPQSYVELGRSDASIKLGHFYSIVGYEGVQSAGNFFYSHAYSYQFAGPFTHWGGLGTWSPNRNWQFQAGLVNGWNNLDELANHVSYLCGAKYTSSTGNWWTSFAIVTATKSATRRASRTCPTAFQTERVTASLSASS
jgi:hypothetical protein